MTDEQFLIISTLLIEIRDALVVLVGPEEVIPDGCQHPENMRVDLRGFSDPEHWMCAVCRYEYRGVIQQ